ncbi:MAG: uncharacterized protein K0S65_2039 [Labilithrix sp.]|nr:uncharacterized protein [Labilithrix sp.]
MPYVTPNRSAFLGALGMVLLSASACRRPSPEPSHEARTVPIASVTTRSAERPPARAPAPSGEIETVHVPDDRDVLVVVGETKRPIVHLHGMCTEARSDLDAWASSVARYGTILALSGDAVCPNGGGRTWAQDPAALDARISAAIEAVAAARKLELDPAQLVLIGESMGASRATSLASRFSDRYTRLVLVGGPDTPSARELRGAKAVALLAGEKEPQEKMRQGAAGLESAGVTARFWELADATHGTYGTDGARSMGEAVAFVTR